MLLPDAVPCVQTLLPPVVHGVLATAARAAEKMGISLNRLNELINGKRGFYCCPACALSEHQQAGRPVEVIELTDYLGSGSLDPAESFIVRNSDVNMCARHEAALGPDKQPMHADFDRCAPGILAFRDLKAAQTFAAEHGGQVLPFADLAFEYRR